MISRIALEIKKFQDAADVMGDNMRDTRLKTVVFLGANKPGWVNRCNVGYLD